MGTSKNAADRRWHFDSSAAQTAGAPAAANDVDGATAALIARLRRQLGRREEIATIGRMTAGIAHELDTPLATLLGALALMTDLVGREQGPASHEDLEKLRAELRGCTASVDRMKDLVGALRGISHRDHRTAVFFDPSRAIRNAAKIFAVVHQRRCRVDLTMRPLPALHGSPTGLGQVVLNLLQNGLEAGQALRPDGQARLAVTATAAEKEVQIAVSDDGPGIPEDVAPRIFEEFFTSNEGDPGRGGGLFRSRQIITAMGGSIDFESVPGRTVFTVRLPFAD